MSDLEKLFIVVDPSNPTPIALERALIMSRLRTNICRFKVFVAVDAESADTRATNDLMFRDQSWFEEVIRRPIEEAGIDYSIEVSWSHEWQRAILQSSRMFGADRIYLPMHSRVGSSRFTFSEAKWDLLKTAECPVVLIQPGAPQQRAVVLAAVNFQARETLQQELNKRILHWGREVSAVYQADFHVVNAFLDSMNYPDRGQLARHAGLSPDKIHVVQGYTDESVSKMADEISADLVVMGTLGQNGMQASRRGNTAARVISALTQDIMVVNSQ